MLTLSSMIDDYAPDTFIEVIWDRPNAAGNFDAYSGPFMGLNNSLLTKEVLYIDNSGDFLHAVLRKYTKEEQRRKR